MTRIAIIDHDEHLLYVEDIPDDILEKKYGGGRRSTPDTTPTTMALWPTSTVHWPKKPATRIISRRLSPFIPLATKPAGSWERASLTRPSRKPKKP